MHLKGVTHKADAEMQLLQLVLRRYLGAPEDLDAQATEKIDWLKFLRAAGRNGVGGFVYLQNKKDLFVPEELVETLKGSYWNAGISNLRQLAELSALLRIFSDEQVDVVPLKGVFDCEAVLGDLAVYPSNDIDILVPVEKLHAAVGLLQAHGYAPVESIAEPDLLASHYHLIYRKDLFGIELHWNLVKRYFSVQPRFWWEDTMRMNYYGIEVCRLRPEKYLLYLVFRLFDHQFSPLKFLVHFAAVIRHTQKLEWAALISMAEQLKMSRLTRFCLYLAHDLLGIGIPFKTVGQPFAGYQMLRRLVIRHIAAEETRPHLQMAILALCLLPVKVSLRVFASMLFPLESEVRLRYQLSDRSRIVKLYQLFNPLIMLFRRK